MSELESAIIGYIAGFFTGSLFILFVLGFVIVRGTDAETPEFYFGVQDWILNYYDSEPQIFGISFAFGFFMGLGSSGLLAKRR